MGDAREVIRRLADRTAQYDFTVWFWGDAIAVDGLINATEALDDDRYARCADQFLGRISADRLTWVDHLAPGFSLLRAADVFHRASYETTGIALADHLLRVVPRMGGLPLYRPDDPRYRYTVWVDTVYHVPRFLAELGIRTGEAHYFDAALSEISGHMSHLTPAGYAFPCHSYDAGTRIARGPGWGRGVGWALLGMVDALELIPEEHWGRAGLASTTVRLAQEVLVLQDDGGCWRTVIDDPDAYLESSTAAMFCAAFAKGVRTGLFGEDYMAAADLAWRYVLQHIDDDGSFHGVSACTWAPLTDVDERAQYKSLPTEVNVWGQGAALRAAVEHERISASAP